MLKNDGLRENECDILAEELSAYLDGELDEKSAARIKEHLNKCKKCAEIYEAMREVSALCAGESSSVEIPEELHLSIMKRIEREQRGDGARKLTFAARMRRIGMICGAGAAAVICFAVLGGPIFRGNIGMDNMLVRGSKAAEADMVAADGIKNYNYSADDYFLDKCEDVADEEQAMEAPELSGGDVPEERYDTKCVVESETLAIPADMDDKEPEAESVPSKILCMADDSSALYYSNSIKEFVTEMADENNILLFPINRSVLP